MELVIVYGMHTLWMDFSEASRYFGFQFASTEIADKLAKVIPAANGC